MMATAIKQKKPLVESARKPAKIATATATDKGPKQPRKGKSTSSQAAPIGREALLDAAVREFSQQGFDKTSMRDIAAAAGMLAGSIYYYFPTKEQLFLAVHEHAIERNCKRVLRAIDPTADPWTRITQAAEGYLDCMLNEFEYASIIIREFPQRRSPELRDALTEHRRRFEDIFAGLVDDLPLRRSVNRSYLRLAIMGMLAWSYTWYKPTGPDSPKAIAQKLISLIRDSIHPT
ncbi:TetR/AcrR family transcriptional regulator [Alcaligenaceae bacterium]|nr:TetR/AcrR family transcriptional regulator [Alcaligenaceae bacterium]